MDAVRTRGRASGGAAACVLWALATGQDVLEPILNKRPAAHVLRLFLRPHNLLRIRIAGERFAQTVRRKRIELLEAHNRDTPILSLLSSLDQVVIDLAAAQHDSLHRIAIADLRIVNKGSKTSGCQFVNA